MPKVRDIESFLFQWAPKELASSWDNVGHLVGRREKTVEKILVALDITAEVVTEAVKGKYDLIVSHHPLIFPLADPVKTIRNDNVTGRILMELIHKDIAAVCMHTNLDVAEGGVNDVLCERLTLTNVEKLGDEDGIGRVGELAEAMPLSAFLAMMRKRLRPNGVRYAISGTNKTIKRVAVGGGSCGDLYPLAAAKGCDTFVTADVKYNQFIGATDMGLTMIDAGHFPTEDPICSAIMAKLEEAFPDVKVYKSEAHREIIQYFM